MISKKHIAIRSTPVQIEAPNQIRDFQNKIIDYAPIQSKTKLKDVIKKVRDALNVYLNDYILKKNNGEDLKSYLSVFFSTLGLAQSNADYLSEATKRLGQWITDRITSIVAHRGADYYAIDALLYVERACEPFPDLKIVYASATKSYSDPIIYFKKAARDHCLEEVAKTYKELMIQTNRSASATPPSDLLNSYIENICKILSLDPMDELGNVLLLRFFFGTADKQEIINATFKAFSKFQLKDEVQFYGLGLLEWSATKDYKNSPTCIELAKKMNPNYGSPHMVDIIRSDHIHGDGCSGSSPEHEAELRRAQIQFPTYQLFNINLASLLLNQETAKQHEIKKYLAGASIGDMRFQALLTQALALLKPGIHYRSLITLLNSALTCPIYGADKIAFNPNDPICSSTLFPDIRTILNEQKKKDPMTFDSRSVAYSVLIWAICNSDTKMSIPTQIEVWEAFGRFDSYVATFVSHTDTLSIKLLSLSHQRLEPDLPAPSKTIDRDSGPEYDPENWQAHFYSLLQMKMDHLGRTELHRAVLRGDINGIQAIVNSNQFSKLNRKDITGKLPLHYALQTQQFDLLTHFKGQILTARDVQGDTILHTLHRLGVPPRTIQREFHTLALDSLINEVNHQNQTPLHVALISAVLESEEWHSHFDFLLDRDTNKTTLSIQDDQGMLPFHYGIVIGMKKENLQKYIPLSGISQNQAWKAMWCRSLQIRNFSKERIAPETLLKMVELHPKTALSENSENNTTLLDWAFSENDADSVTALIKEFNINISAEKATHLITLAVQHGAYRAFDAAIKSLEERQAPMPAPNNPAHHLFQLDMVIQKKLINTVEYLLKNPDLTQWDTYVATSSKKVFDLAEWARLNDIPGGIVSKIAEKIESTPLLKALSSGEPVIVSCHNDNRVLQLHQMVERSKTEGKEILEEINKLIRLHPEYLGFVNSEKQTALHIAAQLKLPNTLRLLAENMDDFTINLQDSEGKTALHYVAISGRVDLLTILEQHAIEEAPDSTQSMAIRTRELAYVAKDNNGFTPLHYAAAYNHESATRHLFPKTFYLLSRKEIDTITGFFNPDSPIRKELDNRWGYRWYELWGFFS